MGKSGYEKGAERTLSLYDSDKDLTLAEQKKIKYSSDPEKTRQEIWDNKGKWKKTKKLLKAGFYGDKQNKKKYGGE